MSTQELMSIVYPLVAGSGLFAAVAKAIYYRQRGIFTVAVIADVVFMLMFSLSIGLLSIVTGPAPRFDIAQLRPWLVAVRGLQLPVLWVMSSIMLLSMFPPGAAAQIFKRVAPAVATALLLAILIASLALFALSTWRFP